jgi:hypothetical protein
MSNGRQWVPHRCAGNVKSATSSGVEVKRRILSQDVLFGVETLQILHWRSYFSKSSLWWLMIGTPTSMLRRITASCLGSYDAALRLSFGSQGEHATYWLLKELSTKTVMMEVSHPHYPIRHIAFIPEVNRMWHSAAIGLRRIIKVTSKFESRGQVSRRIPQMWILILQFLSSKLLSNGWKTDESH